VLDLPERSSSCCGLTHHLCPLGAPTTIELVDQTLVEHAKQRHQIGVQWLLEPLEAADSLSRVATKCLAVWKAITEDTLAKGIQTPKSIIRGIPGKTLEIALLDREAPPARRYQPFDLAAKGNSREKKPD